MAVAYAQFHWNFEFGSKFFPPINQGELALLYMACRGGGRWRADALLAGNRASRPENQGADRQSRTAAPARAPKD